LWHSGMMTCWLSGCVLALAELTYPSPGQWPPKALENGVIGWTQPDRGMTRLADYVAMQAQRQGASPLPGSRQGLRAWGQFETCVQISDGRDPKIRGNPQPAGRGMERESPSPTRGAHGPRPPTTPTTTAHAQWPPLVAVSVAATWRRLPANTSVAISRACVNTGRVPHDLSVLHSWPEWGDGDQSFRGH